MSQPQQTNKRTKGRPWWIIALVFVAAFLIVSGLIYLAIRLTKEQTRSKKSSFAPSTSTIPPPSSWGYETYLATLPQSGVINENVIPKVLTVFMKEHEGTLVTATYPPVTNQEVEAALNQKLEVTIPVSFLELKWNVITIHTSGKTMIFRDLKGQHQTAKSTFLLAPWDWTTPRPENGVFNRHAGGLDPVDWKPFDDSCRLFVISRGVTSALLVRYEQLHAMRAAFNNPIVLVLDSTLAVNVINQLIASQSDEGLCFLIHSTC